MGSTGPRIQFRFEGKSDADRDSLTANSGESVPDDENSRIVDPNGPLLMDDDHHLEKMAQFNRERISSASSTRRVSARTGR